MMRTPVRKVALAALLAMVGVATSSQAQTAVADANGNALPDCYQYAKVQRDAPAHIQTELFVVVDQTTPFNGQLRQSLAQQIAPLLAPGNALSVFAFSAYTQGFYTQRLVHARMDQPMAQAQRDGTGKAQLKQLDQCLQFQQQGIQKLAQEALIKSLGQGGASISKSDVLGSLKDLSGPIRSSTAQRKVVLLASDMLENSSISSFYQGRTVRLVNPEAEMKKVQAQQLLSDFAGAQVYVLGAGLIDSDSATKGVYRDPKVLGALRAFWGQYFEASHAKLQEFGTPDLLGRVQ